MAQVKLLKIAADGVPLEHTAATDDLTMATYTVGTAVIFSDPTTGTINQTAGNLIVDNIMAKERNNVMTTAGAVLFPAITDTAGLLDSFKLPDVNATPTATPTFSATQGYMVAANGRLYFWTGSAWDDYSTSNSANGVDNAYTAAATLADSDAVYISASDNVDKALAADGSATSRCIGFATDSASASGTVNIRSDGVLDGFTSLTAGSRYYLSAASAGLITSTIPVGTGNTVVQVGYAKNATNLHIHIEQLGRRA